MRRQQTEPSPPSRVTAAQFAAMDAISGKTGRGRSKLYRFLWAHLDQIMRDRAGGADWVGAAEQFSKAGLSEDGAPLKPVNVRRVWMRVMKDKQRLAQSKPPSVWPRLVLSGSPPPAPTEAEAGPVEFKLNFIRKP